MVKGSVTMADILIIGGFAVGLFAVFIALMKMASEEGEKDG